MVITAMKQYENKIITLDDIRAAGGCAPGARAFFRRYNLDFKSFLKNGIRAADLLNTGDALAVDVVNRAIKGETDGK